MPNRITTEFVMDTKGGVRNLSQLRTELKNTDGFMAKAKVGAKGLGEFMRAHAAEGAMAAGAALVAFGTKSVTAFQDTALAAGKFSDAAGISVQDASRWNEIAGDMGISGETVSGMFGRLNKAIAAGSPVLEKYNIAIKRNADGTVDANATMLEAIQRVSDLKDPTEQAELATALFGKSWKEAAELVTNGAGNVRTALLGVSDAKVIDEEELQKARDLRASMENLKDSVEDVQLALGEYLVPRLQEAANKITAIGDAVEKTDDKIPGWAKAAATGLEKLGNPIETVIEGIHDLGLSGMETIRELDRYQTKSQDLIATSIDAAQAEHDRGVELDRNADYADYAAGVTQALADAEAEEAEAAKEALKRAQRLTDQYNEQRKRVDDLIAAKNELVGGEIAVRQAQRDAEQAGRDLTDTLKNQKTTLGEAGAAIDDAADSYLNAADQAAQFKADTMRANGTVVDAKTENYLLRTELEKLAASTSGPLHDALMQMIADLNAIPTTKTVDIKVLANGRRVNVGGGLAIGGGVIQEGPSTGARGAQTAQSFGSGRVAAGGGINITVNSLDAKTAGKQIVQALNEYKRAGGNVAF